MHNYKYLIDKMQKKGWSKEELEYAELIFSQHKTHHHIFHPLWDYVLHWFLFFIILLTNLFVFFYMSPIIILSPSFFSYLLLGILGIGLGAIFDIVISDLTHLEKHHHMFIGFIIPVATIVLFMLSMYLIQINSAINLTFSKPLVLSSVYAIFFMIPYYIRVFSK